MDKTKYYVLKKKAVPEVLLKVVEVKRLLAAERGLTIQEATERIGIQQKLFLQIQRRYTFRFMKMKKGRQ